MGLRRREEKESTTMQKHLEECLLCKDQRENLQVRSLENQGERPATQNHKYVHLNLSSCFLFIDDLFHLAILLQK